MSRLARDVRGNALAIMAMAMIPLAGLAGGSIDISRMYITKTRLQHACDAGEVSGGASATLLMTLMGSAHRTDTDIR